LIHANATTKGTWTCHWKLSKAGTRKQRELTQADLNGIILRTAEVRLAAVRK